MYFTISVILLCYVMLVVAIEKRMELVGLLVTASSTSYSSNSSCDSGSGSCNSSCGSNTSFGASNTSLGRWHQAATVAVARCSVSGSNDMKMMNDDE